MMLLKNDGDCVDDDEQLGSFFKVFGSEQRFGGLLLRGKVDTN